MTRQHFQQKRFFIFLRLVIGTATTTKKDDDQLYIKSKKLLYCIVSCRMDDIISEQGGPFRHVATCRHSHSKKKNGKKKERNWENDDKFFFSFLLCCMIPPFISIEKKKSSRVCSTLFPVNEKSTTDTQVRGKLFIYWLLMWAAMCGRATLRKERRESRCHFPFNRVQSSRRKITFPAIFWVA